MNRSVIKINLFIASLFFMLLSFSNVQAQVQKAHYNTYISSNCNGFYDYLPQGYSATGTTLYPLLIFVHGSWEGGNGGTTDLPKVLKHGPPHLIDLGNFPASFTVNNKTFKFIVFSPQFKTTAGASSINAVIDYALKHYKVDPNRIYLTGLSSGGGTVESAAADPTVGKRIAAVVEFAGTSAPSVTRATYIVKNKVAFWGIHNYSDNVVPSSKTIGWINSIVSVNPSFSYRKTVPSGTTNHNCWTNRYPATWTEGGLNIYQWMLQYSKGTASTINTPPIANAGSDKTITLPSSSVTLSGSGTDANGSIAKYSWTKVSGPSSYTFSSTTVASPTVSSLVAGTYIFRLTVTDNAGATGYDNVNVTVNPAVTTYSIPGKVEAENYVTMQGVQKQATSDLGGGQNVGYIDLGDWMDYSVKTAASGTYTITFRVATPDAGAQFQVKNSSGTVLATIAVPNTGDFQTWKDVSATVKLVSGTQTLRLYSSNAAAWNLNYMNFTSGTASGSGTPSSVTKVEAENYNDMSGVQKETTTDAGGGQNLSAIDLHDWAAYYNINAASAGAYTFTFRVSSAVTGGKFEVYDTYKGVKKLVTTISVPNTGGWQVWKNSTASFNLSAGTHVITLVSASSAKWNINYFTYGTSATTTNAVMASTAPTEDSTASATTATSLSVAPNPFSDRFVLQVNNPFTGTMKVQLIDLSGVVRKEFQVMKNAAGSMQTYLSAGTLTRGTYIIKARLGTWTQATQVVKL